MATVATFTSGLGSGLTLYALLFRLNAANTVWDTVTGGGSWQTYNPANLANYVVAMAEVGATGNYQLTLPSGISTTEVVFAAVYEQAGGAAAPLTDTKVGDGPVGPTITPLVVNPVFAALASGEASKGALVAYCNAVPGGPGGFQFPPLGYSLAGHVIHMKVFDPSNGNVVKMTLGTDTHGVSVGGAGIDTITVLGNSSDATLFPSPANLQFVVSDATSLNVLFIGSYTVRFSPLL